MSKRLAYLEKLFASGGADSFATYGLALEYRSLGRLDEALEVFRKLRAGDPDYVAMYLMAGQVFVELGQKDAAIEWLEVGLATAEKKRDSHAAGEIDSLLSSLRLSCSAYLLHSCALGHALSPRRQAMAGVSGGFLPMPSRCRPRWPCRFA